VRSWQSFELDASCRWAPCANLSSSPPPTLDTLADASCVALVSRTVPAKSEHGRPWDYVICSTKNIPDVPPTTVDIISPAVTPGMTTVVLIQNGLNIERPFLERFPGLTVLSGISLVGSAEVAHGQVVQHGPDELIISPFSDPMTEAEERAGREFVRIYSASGKTKAVFTADGQYQRWRKLLYNSSLNPICALLNLDTGRIRLAQGAVEGLVRPAMEEIRAAAQAKGYELAPELTQFMIDIDPLRLYLEPSMQQDLKKVCVQLLCHASYVR
jgi:ketopantoate reductase